MFFSENFGDFGRNKFLKEVVFSMKEKSGTPEFSKIRSIFWPIHGFEMKKFMPMSLLMFCILFVYTAVRDLKDTFIQKYAVLGGAELVSSLKFWFVFPTAILVVMLFSAILSRFGMNKTFYIVTSFFTLFFLAFAFFLFPNRESIHLSAQTMIRMRETWPSFLYYIIPCLGNWSFTLFYILAETWGSLAIGSLFWYFANQITKKDETKRFYALYSLIGNVGVFISGFYMTQMSKVQGQAFDTNVKILVSMGAFFCVATMLMYYYINKVVLIDPRLYDPTQIKRKKKKAKVGFLEGLRVVFTSPYMFLIFMLPMCYGIGMNLYEGIFKAQMAETLTNASDYSRMMGILSMVTGVATAVLTFLGANILRKKSWKFSAMVTPASLAVLGLIFFVLMSYKVGGGKTIMGFSVPIIAIWVGLAIDAVGKGIKYCLFDTTKSMAFRPLDADTQAQGQGAVEVIGGRGGKASGAFIQYFILNIASAGSALLSHTYTIFILFSFLVVGWIISVSKLGTLYEQKITEQEKE
ncbi:MAG: NTP/NDP exchange transporter [Oscillospiraceae bacterium]|nr:NTP/NDP exchange transporter [Oscillospiraceae bacterium]